MSRTLDFIRKEYSSVYALTDTQILSAGIKPKKVLKALRTLKIVNGDPESKKVIRKFEKRVFHEPVGSVKEEGVYNCSDCIFWRYFAERPGTLETTNPDYTGGCNSCTFRDSLKTASVAELWERVGVNIDGDDSCGCKDCALAATCLEYRPTRLSCIFKDNIEEWAGADNTYIGEREDVEQKDIKYLRKEYKDIRRLSDEDIKLSSISPSWVVNAIKQIKKFKKGEGVSLEDVITAYSRINTFEREMFGHKSVVDKEIREEYGVSFADVKESIFTHGVPSNYGAIINDFSIIQIVDIIKGFGLDKEWEKPDSGGEVDE